MITMQGFQSHSPEPLYPPAMLWADMNSSGDSLVSPTSASSMETSSMSEVTASAMAAAACYHQGLGGDYCFFDQTANLHATYFPHLGTPSLDSGHPAFFGYPPTPAASDDWFQSNETSYMGALDPYPCKPISSPSRKKSRHAKCKEKKKCSNCGATKTPSWRRGVAGGKLLCNACGLYERVNGKKRRVFIQPDGSTKVARGGAPDHETCAACKTQEAKRWRKMRDQTYCDRCAFSKEKCASGYHSPSVWPMSLYTDAQQSQCAEQNMFSATDNATEY